MAKSFHCLSGFVTWILFLGTIGLWDAAQGYTYGNLNVCMVNVTRTKETEAPCKDYLEMVLNSNPYTLMMKESFPTQEEYDNRINILMDKDPRYTDKECIFSRAYIEQEPGCCPGWTGPECLTAICEPACSSNGECTSPHVCTCQPGFTGAFCDEVVLEVNAVKQYCYSSPYCHGEKAEGFENKLTYEDDCCKGGGAGWGATGGKCEDCAVVYGGEGVIEQVQDVGFRTCLNCGSSYYRTFDGREYQFQGKCKYTMAADIQGKWQVDIEPIDCDTFETCRKEVTIFIASGEKLSVKSGQVYVDGLEFTVTTEAKSTAGNTFTILKKGDWIMISTVNNNLRLKVDYFSTCYLTLDDTLHGASSGLCGNFNEDFKDDLRTKAGELTTNPTNFGNSWRTDSSCSPTGPIVDYCHDAAMKSEAMEACGILRTGLFRDCRSKVSYTSWYQMCVNEYCKADADQKENVRCYHVGAYAHECAQVDVIVSWRSRDVCAPSCPNGLVYNECSSPCPRSCSNVFADLSESCSTNGPCLSGCECPAGTILQDGKCVTPDKCNCNYNKEPYPPGSVIKRDCNECECDKGIWVCTEERCSSTARMVSMSHIRTYDGQEYDLEPNVAKYVFLERNDAAEDDPRSDLTVSMSFDKCSVLDSSYNRNCLLSVHVSYKSTHITLRGTEVLINGEVIHGNSFYYFNSQDVYIKQATNLYIMVKGFGFQLLYDRARAVYLTLDRFYMHKVRGLFGTYNDNRKDDYMARNDFPATEPHLFAHDYSDSIDSAKRYSRAYQTAAVAEEATQLCELLGSHAVFAGCVGRIDVKFYISKCEDDYIASSVEGRDRVFCDITAAMAMECANIGSEYIAAWTEAPEWKTKCMAYSQCTYGGAYTECASVCNGRCRDTQMSDMTCQEFCVPGCQCPDEQLYNGDGQGPCVTLDQCTCFNRYDSSYVEPNTVTRQGCTNCTCVNATWSCDNENCDEDIICPATQIYRKSITGCEPTCDTIDRSITCSSAITYDGCGCPENTYKTHDGRCVKKNQCPCTKGGEYFEPNSLFEDSCKTYRCVDRHWLKISESDCPGVCWASGDPHYQTFDDVHYSFQGNCEYTLVRDSSAYNRKFEISTTNVECGTTGVACTKAITIKTGPTSVRLVRGHPLLINDVAYTDSLINLANLNITVEFPWTSVFVDDFSVLWDNGTRVFIYLDSKWKGRVEGLCGNFDGIDNNDFQSQSGITDPTDINSFANSWKKATDCPDVDSDRTELIPCSGDQSVRKAWAEESCRIIKEGDLFQKCRDKVSNYQDYYDDCLFDACSCDKGGDCECLCTAIANFAEECNRIGVFVKWRTPRFCPIMCENGLRYTPCMSPCRQTCRNIGNEPEPYCNSTQCVEGCFCPEGYIQHDDGCIPADECPCYENGIEHPSGSVITHECMKCTCIRGKFECEGFNCKPECKDGQFTCDDGQCIGEEFKCDGHLDCRDGSDEAHCNCTSSQFTCQNGDCIDIKDRCDGFKDCADSSDEWYCKHECESSSYEIFQCDNGDCLPASFRCDGHYDCRTDSSDEANCTIHEECDLLQEFRCIETGKCIPKTMVCDGHDDCGDGKDEYGCTTSTSSTTTITTTTATTTTTMPSTTPGCEYVNGFQEGYIKQDEVSVFSDGDSFGVSRDIYPDKGLVIPWSNITIKIVLKHQVKLGFLVFKNPDQSNIDEVQVNIDGRKAITASVTSPIPLHGVLSDHIVIIIKSRISVQIGITISIELQGCFFVSSTTTVATTTTPTTSYSTSALTSTPTTSVTTESKPCDISEGMGSPMKIPDSAISITNGFGDEIISDLRPDGAGVLFKRYSYLNINFDEVPLRLSLMNATTKSPFHIKVTVISDAGDNQDIGEYETPSIVRFDGQTYVKRLQIYFLEEGKLNMELFGCFHFESTTVPTSTTPSTTQTSTITSTTLTTPTTTQHGPSPFVTTTEGRTSSTTESTTSSTTEGRTSSTTESTTSSSTEGTTSSTTESTTSSTTEGTTSSTTEGTTSSTTESTTSSTTEGTTSATTESTTSSTTEGTTSATTESTTSSTSEGTTSSTTEGTTSSTTESTTSSTTEGTTSSTTEGTTSTTEGTTSSTTEGTTLTETTPVSTSTTEVSTTSTRLPTTTHLDIFSSTTHIHTTSTTPPPTTSPICDQIEIDGNDSNMYTLTTRIYGKNMQDAMRTDSGPQTYLEFPTGTTPFVIEFQSIPIVFSITLTIDKGTNDIVAVVASFIGTDDTSIEKSNTVTTPGKSVVTFNIPSGLPVKQINVLFTGGVSIQLSNIFAVICSEGTTTVLPTTTTTHITSSTTQAPTTTVTTTEARTTTTQKICTQINSMEDPNITPTISSETTIEQADITQMSSDIGYETAQNPFDIKVTFDSLVYVDSFKVINFAETNIDTVSAEGEGVTPPTQGNEAGQLIFNSEERIEEFNISFVASNPNQPMKIRFQLFICAEGTPTVVTPTTATTRETTTTQYTPTLTATTTSISSSASTGSTETTTSVETTGE